MKFRPLFLSALLLLGSSLGVQGENWILLPDASGYQLDTDSVMATDAISTLTVRSPEKDGRFSLYTIAFDSDHRSWAIAENKSKDETGEVTSTAHAWSDYQWTKLKPNSFGQNLYDNFIENPLPRFSHPLWLDLYKEQGVQYYGAVYAIERNTLYYENGYAWFWMKVKFPDRKQDISYTIYHVKMNVPYKKVQTLSITVYNMEGKVKMHGTFPAEWMSIQDNTAMSRYADYIQKELSSHRLAMKTTR